MAREIELQILLDLANPRTPSTTAETLKAKFDYAKRQLTQTTQAVFSDTVTVTTSEQDISLPTNSKFTAALQGIFCAVNLDATNYVKLGPKSGGSMVEYARLYPLFPIVVPVAPSVVQRWVADTSSCAVMFVWAAK